MTARDGHDRLNDPSLNKGTAFSNASGSSEPTTRMSFPALGRLRSQLVPAGSRTDAHDGGLVVSDVARWTPVLKAAGATAE
jgi:hypothetical protein